MTVPAVLDPFVLARIGSEYWLFGGAGLVTMLAFVGLILVPALSSFGRGWEKAAAGFLSLFVLLALVLIGIGIGVAIVYYYNDLVDLFSQG
jgi:hypothetical protein